MPCAASGQREQQDPSRRAEECMDVYCGIDWAEDHYDIALVGRDGDLLARRRISDDAAVLVALLALLAEHGDTPMTWSRWRSRPRAGCWSRACAPPAGGSTRSTRCRCPGTVTGTRSRAQIRPWRLGRAGQRAAHRPARAPAAARRQRVGPGHRGPGPDSARRRLGPHHRAQQALLPPSSRRTGHGPAGNRPARPAERRLRRGR